MPDNRIRGSLYSSPRIGNTLNNTGQIKLLTQTPRSGNHMLLSHLHQTEQVTYELQTSNLNTERFGKRSIGFHEPRYEGGMLRISVRETETRYGQSQSQNAEAAKLVN